MQNDYWMNRRTIRRYTSRTIPPELLNELLLKASHAPTTGNMQLYSVVISTSEEDKAALAPTHFNQPQVKNAAAVLTFCADFNRFSKWCECRQAEPCYDNLQSFVAAAIDTIAFAQQFNTLAEDAGLGCCWLGTTTYNAPQIAEILQLPTLVVPVITLTVGYPDEDGTDVGRLPFDADIDRLYAEKEGRPDSEAFVKENGKQTLAQVFTDVRYPRKNNELFSDIFRSFLQKAKFV